MSDLRNDAITAAADAHGVTWQDAADVIDPFLRFVAENMWDYGFGSMVSDEPLLEVLLPEPDSPAEEEA